MESFTFMNKIIGEPEPAETQKNKKGGGRTLIRVFLVLGCLAAIWKIITDGFSVYLVFIPLFVVSMFWKKPKETDKAVPFSNEKNALGPRADKKFSLYSDTSFFTRVKFKDGELMISYLNLNRNAALNFKSQEYHIAPKDIREARYNAEYNMLMIASKARVVTTSESGEAEEKDFRGAGEYCNNILCLTEEATAPALEMMKEICDDKQFIIEGYADVSAGQPAAVE